MQDCTWSCTEFSIISNLNEQKLYLSSVVRKRRAVYWLMKGDFQVASCVHVGYNEILATRLDQRYASQANS